MDVKEAIRRAKTYVAEMFSDENIANIGLEEVRRDEDGRNWLITVGFSRVSPVTKPTALLGLSLDLPRIYKVVAMNDQDGELISITNRAVEH